ncbi:DGQHR domain-containing protein [Ureibacillus chungkukjangi]|uniref:DNA sulfur modification protein DndB n=1 Tax=Ureibacillus chungkukjangi TaxID=1202712 RepID=A0A318U5M8_9BACL|nr:DGQHR domain-containing protein [Ureibacillus chungkukjangi]PYF07219.1 DNA sulfur modification protein DndB [Ureibacillus chungkukjangi]
MSNDLLSNIAIENVIQSKMRGRVTYQGFVSSQVAVNFSYSKLFNDPSGKGYQRPIDKKRCKDFANYLSKGEEALYTPILLNAAGHWEFHSYDNLRPNYGRLICKKKATLMDGQHRLGGIEAYIKETDTTLNVPFLAFHFLDEDEEIKLFDVINTKAKGIGTSLSRYLNRGNDEISWIATNLILKPESPFFSKGTLIGKRTKEKNITLQNLYNIVKYLTKKSELEGLSKEKKLNIALFYFNLIKELFPEEWEDSKDYKITHITCLYGLAIAGNKILNDNYLAKPQQVDSVKIANILVNLKEIDWSSNGDLKYIKGLPGANMLASDILNCLRN